MGFSLYGSWFDMRVYKRMVWVVFLVLAFVIFFFPQIFALEWLGVDAFVGKVVAVVIAPIIWDLKQANI